MYEYTIYCLACGSHVSQGGLEALPQLGAAEVLATARHNPGCELNHVRRAAPVVLARRDIEQRNVMVYSIQPGAWNDAEMVLE